jgi:alanine-glyoxylate transaminase/serine-glyoxylate transaminase/serine-pyruvate transaminase
MDEVCELLRQVFRTRNALTFPVSGTGMAGMECAAVNLVEPGDEVIVGVNGVFGTRMKDVMERCGAVVHALEAPWGETFTLEQVAAAFAAHPKARLLGIVHAETSTGAHQPLEGLAAIARSHGALLLVDAEGERELPRADKLTLARQLVAEIAARLPPHRAGVQA